jgi:hypothetical protein
MESNLKPNKTAHLGRILIAPALAAGLMLLAPAANAGLYCCNDPSGKKVCGDTMPKSCIGRDTTLRDKGTTKQIEGMLTPEQRALREEEEERKRKAEEVDKEQRRRDLALLNTYVSVKDIDVARERAEGEVQSQIKAAEAKIAAAEGKRKKLEREAEFYKNKQMPEDINRGMKDAEFEIKAQSELIDAKKKDFATIKVKFDADKKRYEELQKARNAPR